MLRSILHFGVRKKAGGSNAITCLLTSTKLFKQSQRFVSLLEKKMPRFFLYLKRLLTPFPVLFPPSHILLCILVWVPLKTDPRSKLG